MGLFNNQKDTGTNILNSLVSSAGLSLGGGIVDAVESAYGSLVPTSVQSDITSAATRIASNILDNTLSDYQQNAINKGYEAYSDIMNGNYMGAAEKLLMNFNDVRYMANDLLGQSGRLGRPVPLLGGLSLDEVKKSVSQVANTDYSHQNRYIVEVAALSGKQELSEFNMFAVDLQYSPFNVTSENVNIGSTFYTTIRGSEPVELSMTVFDDDKGTLKKWFSMMHERTAHRDGTVGLPYEYGIKITIIHSLHKRDTSYRDIGIFKVSEMPIEMSRREDALCEMNITFSQIDGFIKP